MALTDNLAAYWKCDEVGGILRSAVDSSGDLNRFGNPGSVAGKINTARDFDGSTNFFLADIPLFETGDIDFTWTCWVNISSLATPFRGILGKCDNSSTTGEYLLFLDGSNRPRFTVTSNGSNFTGVSATSFGAISTGVWTFIVARHDSVNNFISIQVNNGPVDSVSWSNGAFVGTSTFMIGQAAGTDPKWLGQIDEVGFWKNRVLSLQDSSDLYSSGNAFPYPFTVTLAQLNHSGTGRPPNP